MASDMGHGLSSRDALLALSVGQIAGALTVQYFGQIVARSALLGPRGVSAPANIVLATYERIVAAAVSAVLAVVGAWNLFGHVALDLQSGGDRMIEILAGLAVAVIAGGMYGWGARAIDAAQHYSKVSVVVSIVRSACLTLTTQLCTVAAYVVATRSLAPNVDIVQLVAASMIVTFVASLPISFAGWGVRELSSLLAFSAIGLQSEIAIVVAMLIGVAAMTAVVIIAIAATILPDRHSSVGSVVVETPKYEEIATAVLFAIPLLTATAVFFQVFVPIGTTLLNVNLADPVAILGGSLFVLYSASGGLPKWRLNWINTHVAVATGMMIFAFLHGLYSFGWSDWAFTNKLLGWLILLGYGATGALIVKASDRGMLLLVRTFVAVAAGIVSLEILFIVEKLVGIPLPQVFGLLPMEGFSQNRNAFAFVLLLAVCGSVLIKDRAQGWIFGLLLVGIWFAGSRAGFGALFAILAIGLSIRAFALRNIAFGIGVAAAILAAVASLHFVVNLMGAGGGGKAFTFVLFPMTPVSSDAVRLTSIANGLEMFLAHPLIGKGLGAYASETVAHGQFVVIHSTPIWLLAELGLVGFLPFAVAAIRIFWNEWKSNRRDGVGQMLLLILVTFGIMSSVHELLYQRALWLLLGAGLACVSLNMKAKNEFGEHCSERSRSVAP